MDDIFSHMCLLSLDQLVGHFQMPTMEGKSLVFIAAELIDCLHRV